MTGDVDFDSVVDLEQQYYQKGFDEAFAVGQNHSLKDGKQFGIQTGFQRFILIGAIKKTFELINALPLSENDPVKLEKSKKSISEMLDNINKFYSENSEVIVTTNTTADVEVYEEIIKKIRSKAKIVYTKLGYKTLYPELENTCKLVSGEIPSTQINGVEKDMW